ncbi:MAG TPA: hypothetical protein VGV63_09860, partial [Acidimicrobiales bacterium]|nr:hypothetical protein [Acidimicrobiales bacterium]
MPASRSADDATALAAAGESVPVAGGVLGDALAPGGAGARVAGDQVVEAGRVELTDVKQPGTSDDLRLVEAFRVLEREQISVLSLDVFDTLVWRIVPEPVDAFVLLGQRLHDRGHLSPHVPVELFARLRERAERKARSRVPVDKVPEISLEQIYDEMPAHLFNGLGPEVLAGHEVALEHDIIFPDLDIAHLARHAQDQYGARVVLVSDTYLSPAQLRSVVACETVADLAISEV